MAAVRRHWALFAALPLLILTVIIAFFSRSVASRPARAATPSTASPVTPATPVMRVTPAMQEQLRAYERIRGIRSELALEDQDLAALGVSPEATKQVLLAVISFDQTSKEALANADAACQGARRMLQEAVRRINVGPRDDGIIASLPTLKQNVANTYNQRQAVFGALVTQVNALLNGDQQQMWMAARQNSEAGLIAGGQRAPGVYRYVAGLTAEQVEELNDAQRRGRPAELDGIASHLLSSMQVAQAQNARNNRQLRISGVAVAESQILPTPELLKIQAAALSQEKSSLQ